MLSTLRAGLLAAAAGTARCLKPGDGVTGRLMFSPVEEGNKDFLVAGGVYFLEDLFGLIPGICD